MSAELHPHDQHGRHGTHDIVPHGAKERSQVEESFRKTKLPPLSLARGNGKTALRMCYYIYDASPSFNCVCKLPRTHA